jgi:hypothetical protein
MPIGELNELRQTLLRFFQDKKIKVSLFLQDKYQLQDGVLVLTPGGVLPPDTDLPGIINTYDTVGKHLQEKLFTYPIVTVPRTSDTPKTPFGLNLYKKTASNSPVSKSQTPPFQEVQPVKTSFLFPHFYLAKTRIRCGQ